MSTHTITPIPPIEQLFAACESDHELLEYFSVDQLASVSDEDVAKRLSELGITTDDLYDRLQGMVGKQNSVDTLLPLLDDDQEDIEHLPFPKIGALDDEQVDRRLERLGIDTTDLADWIDGRLANETHTVESSEADHGNNNAVFTGTNTRRRKVCWRRITPKREALSGEENRHRNVARHRRSGKASKVLLIKAKGAMKTTNRWVNGYLLGAVLAVCAMMIWVFPIGIETFLYPDVENSSALATAPPTQFILAAPAQRWHVDEPALESKLDEFLVNHQEQSSSSGMKGTFPYAGLVGYESDR